MSRARKPRVVAHVIATDPPGPMTLDEWIVWRMSETARMFAEAAAQAEAMLERPGATLH